MADTSDHTTQSTPYNATQILTAPGGDGSQFDIFEESRVFPIAEAKFLKQPRTILKLKENYPCDGTELDGLDDLPVLVRTEAKVFKPPTQIPADGDSFGKIDMTTRAASAGSYQLKSPSVSSSPEQNLGLLPFTCELRDKIYGYMFCDTYLVKLLPFTRGDVNRIRANTGNLHVFTHPMHPDFQSPPLGVLINPLRAYDTVGVPISPLRVYDTVAPWTGNPPDYELHRQCRRQEKIKELDERLVKRWDFAKTSSYLPICVVSKATREEATSSLFKHGTFFFALNKPGTSSLPDHAIDGMTKIHIKIDLLTAYMRRHSVADQAYTLESATGLIQKLGGNKIKRETCIISIERGEDTLFLTRPSVWEPIKALTGFQTVVIKMTFAYKEWLEGFTFALNDAAPLLKSLYWYDVTNLLYLHSKLRRGLGSGKVEFERKEFYYLIYHPQAHLNNGQAPTFDIDALTDPPVSFSSTYPFWSS